MVDAAAFDNPMVELRAGEPLKATTDVANEVAPDPPFLSHSFSLKIT